MCIYICNICIHIICIYLIYVYMWCGKLWPHHSAKLIRSLFPETWEDPTKGSTLPLHNLHPRSIGVKNWGFLFFGSFQGSGLKKAALARVYDRFRKAAGGWPPKGERFRFARDTGRVEHSLPATASLLPRYVSLIILAPQVLIAEPQVYIMSHACSSGETQTSSAERRARRILLESCFRAPRAQRTPEIPNSQAPNSQPEARKA